METVRSCSFHTWKIGFNICVHLTSFNLDLDLYDVRAVISRSNWKDVVVENFFVVVFYFLLGTLSIVRLIKFN